MYSFGVIMNPIEKADINRDSTIAIIAALQEKSKIYYILPNTLHISNNKIYAKTGTLTINKKKKVFYEIKNIRLKELSTLNCILFRLDPPVDEHYIQITHILDILESQGVLIINSPQSVRDFNEKLLGNKLTSKLVPTLVTSNEIFINSFLKKYKKIVIKPMNLMSGKGIVSLSHGNRSNKIIIKELIKEPKKYMICQKFLKEIVNGDTRILITNGIVHENVLVRYPPKNDFRSNLSYGGRYKIKKINKKFINNLKEVALYLKYNRIYFAGVDMIGDYITEINITSPTGIKQIEESDKNISKSIATEFINIINDHYD
tara:strand:+ start:390 stop:1340 length:951 start_codon:yes stop_codon:yes gene_type:complete